jgi:hypothetical protein
MLYGLSLTRGARLEPWSPTVALGAAVDGDCLRVHLHGEDVWRGTLLLDAPRHARNVGLPVDYPRLNQWPEWWTVDPVRRYAVTMTDGTLIDLDGEHLATGLPVSLAPNVAAVLKVCPR